MANIMLNTVCNLGCPYCFARSLVHPDSEENREHPDNITLEDFQKALNFAVHDRKDARIGIIGGEPTLHPDFREIMKTMFFDDRVTKITVFTNGLEIDRHISELLHPKVGMLVNLNPPERIGEDKFSRIIENLDKLIRGYHMWHRVTLGINMSGANFPYRYVLETLERYGMNHVRTSIVVPNREEMRQMDPLEYFKSMKPYVFEFFAELKKRNIMPTYDCNYMPPCILSDEELKWLKSFWDLEKKAGRYCNIADYSKCGPVLDILPSLKAVRCFGLSYKEQVPIDSFKNIGELKDYFYNVYDAYAFKVHVSNQCRRCPAALKMRCMGGCIAFKDEKIDRAKELLASV